MKCRKGRVSPYLAESRSMGVQGRGVKFINSTPVRQNATVPEPSMLLLGYSRPSFPTFQNRANGLKHVSSELF